MDHHLLLTLAPCSYTVLVRAIFRRVAVIFPHDALHGVGLTLDQEAFVRVASGNFLVNGCNCRSFLTLEPLFAVM